MKNRHYIATFVILAALLLGLFFLHLQAGFHYFTKEHLLAILFFGGTPEERLTVFDFRMVRSILAVLIGMGLAVSGAVFQTISKNELASPSLLGVNAGAALAVMLLIYGSSSATGLGIWQQPLAAVVGGALAAALVFFLSHRRGRMTSTYNLVLNGIAVTAGLHALQILLLVSLDPTRFQQVNTWLIGSIFGNSWTHVDILFFIVLAGLLFLLANHETLDLLALREETALGLGLRVNRTRFVLLMAAVVLASSCVAVGGSIGFVGLICPHIARRLVGVAHCRYLPVTALLGGILLVAADYTARIIIAPDEMLVGLVVSLIGAPYFLYILLRSKG
ncbi:iron ABC transporter permease [Mitsuokella jalaludinii]|uniref:FecCD family ABC transporter permease n=2 Tax=Mitsuokella jalaludinii TaxID=187979 RepID=UPI001D023AF0|nr:MULTISPECIES: iron ABC transporter permease [Mitsuokella]MCB5723989.1 iron ABC transporter permease [Mitsuokella jalaludinii]